MTITKEQRNQMRLRAFEGMFPTKEQLIVQHEHSWDFSPLFQKRFIEALDHAENSGFDRAVDALSDFRVTEAENREEKSLIGKAMDYLRRNKNEQ